MPTELPAPVFFPVKIDPYNRSTHKGPVTFPAPANPHLVKSPSEPCVDMESIASEKLPSLSKVLIPDR